MSLFDILAWGFVTFTGLLVMGVLYLWWLERQRTNLDAPHAARESRLSARSG